MSGNDRCSKTFLWRPTNFHADLSAKFQVFNPRNGESMRKSRGFRPASVARPVLLFCTVARPRILAGFQQEQRPTYERTHMTDTHMPISPPFDVRTVHSIFCLFVLSNFSHVYVLPCLSGAIFLSPYEIDALFPSSFRFLRTYVSAWICVQP